MIKVLKNTTHRLKIITVEFREKTWISFPALRWALRQWLQSEGWWTDVHGPQQGVRSRPRRLGGLKLRKEDLGFSKTLSKRIFSSL